MQRAQVLDAAKAAVASRPGSYGNPEDNFQRIATLWNAHLDNTSDVGADRTVNFDAGDVAIMLGMVKLARLQSNMRHEDSWIDLAGYAACGAEVSHAGFKPDPISEMLYGDAPITPANAHDISAEIRRECEPFYDERAAGAQLAGEINWSTWPFLHVTFVPEVHTKFGFRLGETVNLSSSPYGRKPGKVCGFTNTDVNLRWGDNKLISAVEPILLRHGP